MSEETIKSEEPKGPQFSIQRTYIKDLSFETPMGFKVFSQAFKPKVKLDVNTKVNNVSENVNEIVLTLTITATLEEETAYLLELQQAGIFAISGFPDDQIPHVIGAVCPNFLFPYAREVIDSTVVKGGFPPLSLAPIDFDAIYRQTLAGRKKSNESLN